MPGTHRGMANLKEPWKKRARWYVYELYDQVGNIQYIGKGSRGRLISQCKRYELRGEKIANFWCEIEAYKHEKERIEAIKPPLNKQPGGCGSWSGRYAPSDRKFYADSMKYGEAWAAASVLIDYFGLGFVEQKYGKDIIADKVLYNYVMPLKRAGYAV